jgi:hypothetical protein
MLALLAASTGPFWFVAAVLALAVLTSLLACYFFL